MPANIDPRNHEFDLLRGIAILAVICVHTVQNFDAGFILIDKFFYLGRFGVQLFYFVSALTMCYLWDLRAHEKSPVLKFYLRRFLRIVPLFFVVMSLYLVANWIAGEPPPALSNLILHLTFLFGFWPNALLNTLVPGSWSIAVEMNFYVLFPIIITRIKKPINFLFISFAIYVANILIVRTGLKIFFDWLYGGDSFLIIGDFYYENVFNQIHIFFLGIFIYKVFAQPRVIWSEITQAAVIFLIWLTFSVLWRSEFGSLSYGAAFLGVVYFEFAIVVAILTLKMQQGLIERFGQLSYSIYFAHFSLITLGVFLFDRIGIPTNGPIAFALGLSFVIVSSYFVALFSEVLIEKNINKFTKVITSSF